MNRTSYNRKKLSELIQRYSTGRNVMVDVYTITDAGVQSKILKELEANADNVWDSISNYLRKKTDISELKILFRDIDSKLNVGSGFITIKKNEAAPKQPHFPEQQQPIQAHPLQHPALGGLGLGDIGAIVQFELDKEKTKNKIESLEEKVKELEKDLSDKDTIIEEYERRSELKENIGFYANLAKEVGFNAIASKIEGIAGIEEEGNNKNNKQIAAHDSTGIVDDGAAKPKIEQIREQILQYINSVDNERHMARIFAIIVAINDNPDLLPTIESLIENEHTPKN